MIDSLKNPQLSRLKDCHHRLFNLLDSTRLRTLEYLPFPSPVRPQERQQELSLFADLTTLHSLATEFFSLLKTSRPHGSIDVLKKHSADLALPSDLETYENWLNELDSRGVEIWNHASQVKRVLETKSTGGSLRDYRKQSYDISLNLLREQSTHVKRKTGFSEFRPSDITPSEKVYSGLRQLAFILIHAGTPTEIDTTGALRMIKIASKSAKAQLAICNLELAIKNVDIASEYEDKFQSINTEQELGTSDFLDSMLEYYSTKADCSWASGNETGTIFNLRKALELFKSNHRIFELKDKIYIVSRLYTFAYVILRLYDESNNDDRLHNETKTNAKLLKAYEWLSLGLDVLENNELEKDSYGTLPLGDKPSWWNLKLKILKALAYAYSEAGSLELNKDHAKSLRMKGDRALDEALAMNPDQTICLVKIQSVSRKSSSDSDLKSAFSSALRTNPFDSELIGKLMSVAHKVEGESIRVELFAKIFLECLTKETDEQRHLGDSAFYALVLNSVASQRQFLKHSLDKSKETPILNRDSDNSKKLKYLREVSDAGTISNSEFRLASDCAFMTQTVIWHFADQEYRAMSFRTAAEWYEFGTHPLFLETGNLTFAKLTRKASLSWLNHGNYEFAGRCLKSLPSICFKESGTHFLSFMIEAAQGNEENAARAIDRIMACLDFKTEILLYAARQADHRGLKGLLHHILEKILDATVGGSVRSAVEELDLVILLRSLIRIDITNLNTSIRDRVQDAKKLLEHFQIVKLLLIKSQNGELQVSSKEASWFWKTAFNSCIGITSDWKPDLVLEFFDISADLIELSRKIPSALEEVQPLIHHEVHCRFASLAGRLNQALNSDLREDDRTELSHSLTNAISRLKKLCNESEELSLDGPSAEKLTKIKCCIWVWEFETYCLGRDWSSVEDFIQELKTSIQYSSIENSSVLESIADIACHDNELPTKLIMIVLENVVKLIQTQSGINVSLCSRWLRILIDLKVSNGDDQGGLKHAETAIQLQRNYPTYPSDEANWILARSWDRSIDLYSSKNIELSKKWCEVSLNWMKIVVGGRSYEDMMNRHYQDLLKLTTTSDEPAHLLLE